MDPKVAAAPQSRRRTTTGGLILWGGTISIGFSTVILLAILSRHIHHEGFSQLSSLFGLFFVGSLIPSGIPIRVAALVSDGAEPLKLRTTHYAMCVAIGAVISPIVGVILHVPIFAVAFVCAQVIISIPLSIRRGPLIAHERFAALGGNLFFETTMRILLGSVLGLLWGVTGLSAGLALASGCAFLAIRVRSENVVRTERPTTSMFDTWLTMVLLGLLVQVDILIAPSGLTKAAATRYDLAAVPSKGVYLVLLAASTFIFPYIRKSANRRTVLLGSLATMGLGLITTLVLVAARGLIGNVLGQHAAAFFLLLALGVAMSLGGATGVVVNGDIALGSRRPWPPLILGIIAIAVGCATRPTATTFAVVVLTTQTAVFLTTLSVLMLRRRRTGLAVPLTPVAGSEDAVAPMAPPVVMEGIANGENPPAAVEGLGTVTPQSTEERRARSLRRVRRQFNFER
jgi:hypothetical protein